MSITTSLVLLDLPELCHIGSYPFTFFFFKIITKNFYSIYTGLSHIKKFLIFSLHPLNHVSMQSLKGEELLLSNSWLDELIEFQDLDVGLE